jgi:predicted ATPase
LEKSSKIISNLPSRGTSFIGRDIERLELAELLAETNVRLLTIIGQGGVGKTRLAVEVAREMSDHFPDGVVYAPLETVKTQEQLLTGLASAFSVPLTKAECIDQIASVVADRQVLLLLDNAEHLLQPLHRASRLLQKCPNLKILVTSRERLNLEEEWLYTLEGFSPPHEVSLETAELNDAVSLFVQRARKVKQAFTLTQECLPFVLQICRRVEGLPLGIELAAAWTKTLSCKAIAENLEDLDFLTAQLINIPERQQSLRLVFEGSWNLLSKEEQNVSRKLSVFRGGFTSEAAREVAGATLLMLARLVDRSLLRVSANSRYEFHPLLQHYLKEKLVAAHEEEQTASDHAQYFLALAERAKTFLRSPSAGEWLKHLDSEFANINAALTWLQLPETAPLAMRLVSALSRFWESQKYLSQGRKWAGEILRRTSKASLERAHLLLVAGNLALFQGDYREATKLYQDSLRAWQTFGDKEGEVKTLNNIAIIAWQEGDYAYAKQTYEACLDLCRNLNDVVELANVTFNLGNLYTDLAEVDKAQVLMQESLRMYRQLGSKHMIGNNLLGLGMVAFERGDYDAATDYAREGLATMREVAYKIGEADALNFLGQLACVAGDYPSARTFLREALEIKKEGNEKAGIALSLQYFGQLELAEGKANKAVTLWAVAAGIREVINMALSPRTKERHERYTTRARNKLGEAAFQAAWRQGSLLTLEQAVVAALHQGD